MARTVAKDHDAKRDLILTRAAQIFARQGYGRASMSQVADACGISKANIYHYYASKDDILFAILRTHLRRLRTRVMALPVGDKPPEHRLRATVAEILMAYEGADDAHRVQSMGMEALSRSAQKELQSYQRELVAHVAAILHACAPNVFDGQTAKLRAATMSIFGMLNWFYMWQSDATRSARQDYAETVSTLVLKGIKAL